MSSKTKSISDLVTDLQTENESLKKLQKIADSYTKMEFGYSVKDLHALVDKQVAYEKRCKERDSASQGQQATF